MPRVTEQSHVLVHEGFVTNRAESDPLAVVRDEVSTGDVVLEDLSNALDALGVADSRRKTRCIDLVEPGPLPRVLMHLDDERAELAVHRVGVDLHDAPRRIAYEELEGVIDRVGAQPHVLALARVDRGAEFRGVLLADR